MTLLSEMTSKLMISLRELETLRGCDAALSIERRRKEEVEQELQTVRLDLDSQLGATRPLLKTDSPPA